jgi:hypothetical protein
MPYTQLARLGRTFAVVGTAAYVGGARETAEDGTPRARDPFVCRSCGDGSIAPSVCSRCGLGLVPTDERYPPMLVVRPGERPRGKGRWWSDRAAFAALLGGAGGFVGLSLVIWDNANSVSVAFSRGPAATIGLPGIVTLAAIGLGVVASAPLFLGSRALLRRRRFAEAARLAGVAREQTPVTPAAAINLGLVRVRGRVRADDPTKPVATVEADGTRTSRPFSIADASGAVRVIDAAFELWDAAGSDRVHLCDGDEIEILGTVVERHEPGPASDRDGYRERRATRVLGRQDDVPLHIFRLAPVTEPVPVPQVRVPPAEAPGAPETSEVETVGEADRQRAARRRAGP